MPRDINILLVDDDDNLNIIYDKILHDNIKEPFIFDHVGIAEEIEEKIQEKKYDIIILDQRLNNGNRGLDFLPLIRKNNMYSYVIINSAYGNEELAAQAIKNGANNYIKGNKENNSEFINVIQEALDSVEKSMMIQEMSSNFLDFQNNLENKTKNKIEEIKINRISQEKKLQK